MGNDEISDKEFREFLSAATRAPTRQGDSPIDALSENLWVRGDSLFRKGDGRIRKPQKYVAE